MKVGLLLILVELFSAGTLPSVPAESSGFCIGRNKDANKIYYTINVDAHGNLNPEEPVSIFWKKYTDHGKTEPLTWIQDKLAYGLEVETSNPQEAHFHFVSYDEKSLVVRKDQTGEYRVFISLQGKEVVLERIFITISGGTFLIPIIDKVEVFGWDQDKHTEVLETIKP